MTGGRTMRPARQSMRRAVSEGDSRWRRAQRARRRRLSSRGRATIVAVLGFVTALGALAVGTFGRESGAQTRLASVTPEVSAGAPRPPSRRVEPDLPVTVPSAVLARLPISRETLDLPVTKPRSERSRGRLYEWVDVYDTDPDIPGPLRVEYTLDAALTRHVFRVLQKGRVKLGNVVVLEPTSGRVLAYASTDPEHFPPTRNYPAASLVKVITAAAALDKSPETARLPCRYRGSPYRLTPSRIDPPTSGRTVTLRRALATSNNQCFAQLAVHAVGAAPLLAAIRRFGWTSTPAVAHSAGTAEAGEERYELGKLGCGLDGCRITPLHAVQLAATLVHGELVTPRWIERVADSNGRELELPATPGPRRVLPPELTAELRSMLVDTTLSGTARSAFRKRGGRPLLGDIRVAGKTGSLNGKNPDGRYEWFVGVAPAESPRVAIATVVVQGSLWWRNSSQIAAAVLEGVFCEKGRCDPDRATRLVQVPEGAAELARVPAAAAPARD